MWKFIKKFFGMDEFDEWAVFRKSGGTFKLGADEPVDAPCDTEIDTFTITNETNDVTAQSGAIYQPNIVTSTLERVYAIRLGDSDEPSGIASTPYVYDPNEYLEPDFTDSRESPESPKPAKRTRKKSTSKSTKKSTKKSPRKKK